MTDLDASARNVSATVIAVEIIRRARATPGPLARFTGPQLVALQRALADYIDEKFPGWFTRQEADELAQGVIVQNQARAYTGFDADDLGARDDPLEDVLLRLARDAALDKIQSRNADEPSLLPAQDRLRDEDVVATIFGRTATPDDVRYALRELFDEGHPADFQIVQCYLDLVEIHGGELPRDRDVSHVVGVSEAAVRVTMYHFANRLGRRT
jgi:hypothetical protein